MIRLSNIKLPCSHSEVQLKQKLQKLLKLKPQTEFCYQIIKRSVDARQKPDVQFVYVIDVQLKNGNETKTVQFLHNPNIVMAPDESYVFPKCGSEQLKNRPVIAGFGPAGIFCGYLLAQHGYAPIILERGGDVDERSQAVGHFWKTGTLNPEMNVSFGEGGAGTFSDGKLNTLVKDKWFRNHKVLELFVKHGAPEEILYLQKPHIGTDILRNVVKSMREEIRAMGGEVYFHAKMTGIDAACGRLKGVWVNEKEYLPCDVLVLAAGHSARDTFGMLSKQLVMQPKSFAIGVRVEHPQEMINCSQYGAAQVKGLGAADYKLTYQASNNRGVYSFCMCPGGFVVNASSEPGRLAVNGMSNHARNEKNANSALIVTVTPEDFGGDGVLCGMEFQRRLEEAAYRQCEGKIPVQLHRDFAENRVSTGCGEITPCMKGAYGFGNLREVLPEAVSQALIEAMPSFGSRIKGFDREDAVFSGIESRTSSPLRIVRNEECESNIKGIYPCGEGAGYAGGITSAAMDGILIAEKIAGKYQPARGERI